MKSMLTYQQVPISPGQEHTLIVKGHFKHFAFLDAGRVTPEPYFWFESDGISRKFVYRVFESGDDIPSAHTYLCTVIGPAGTALHLYGRA